MHASRVPEAFRSSHVISLLAGAHAMHACWATFTLGHRHAGEPAGPETRPCPLPTWICSPDTRSQKGVHLASRCGKRQSSAGAWASQSKGSDSGLGPHHEETLF